MTWSAHPVIYLPALLDEEQCKKQKKCTKLIHLSFSSSLPIFVQKGVIHKSRLTFPLKKPHEFEKLPLKLFEFKITFFEKCCVIYERPHRNDINYVDYKIGKLHGFSDMMFFSLFPSPSIYLVFFSFVFPFISLFSGILLPFLLFPCLFSL